MSKQSRTRARRHKPKKKPAYRPAATSVAVAVAGANTARRTAFIHPFDEQFFCHADGDGLDQYELDAVLEARAS